jgi:hypothetical protein
MTIKLKIGIELLLLAIVGIGFMMYANSVVGAPLTDFWPPRPVLMIEEMPQK